MSGVMSGGLGSCLGVWGSGVISGVMSEVMSGVMSEVMSGGLGSFLGNYGIIGSFLQ